MFIFLNSEKNHRERERERTKKLFNQEERKKEHQHSTKVIIDSVIKEQTFRLDTEIPECGREKSNTVRFAVLIYSIPVPQGK